MSGAVAAAIREQKAAWAAVPDSERVSLFALSGKRLGDWVIATGRTEAVSGALWEAAKRAENLENLAERLKNQGRQKDAALVEDAALVLRALS